MRLLLWQAQQDRATELIIGLPVANETGTPIRYKVDGAWVEFASPPADFRVGLASELVRLAALSVNDRYPKEGILDLLAFTGPLKWSILIPKSGGEILLRRLR